MPPGTSLRFVICSRTSISGPLLVGVAALDYLYLPWLYVRLHGAKYADHWVTRFNRIFISGFLAFAGLSLTILGFNRLTEPV